MDKMSWNRDEKVASSSYNPYDSEVLDNDENISHSNSDIQQQRLPLLYHGTWPMERDLWNNLQCDVNQHDNSSTIVASVMSFTSDTSTRVNNSNHNNETSNEGKFDVKMDVIYSLLGMLLGDHVGREDTSTTLLSLSNSAENCLAMKESGCLPLLIQLIHAPEQNPTVRKGASRALYNIVTATQDKKFGREELEVLELIEQIRDYSVLLRRNIETDEEPLMHSHPISAMSALLKNSFIENYRHAICQMGGLHAIGELIEMDLTIHGTDTNDPNCISLRKYAGMILTNLTFGDSKNKSLLCSFECFIKAWVAQLQSNNEDLHQVTASVLRNLSWRADANSKKILREAGSVTNLTIAAMQSRREPTLKSILSALWNFSAHCTTNKANICSVDGALSFLVDMLSFKIPSKRLAIVENAGGILRNISSHVAIEENYRQILRNKNCLHTLVRLLSSTSDTVVSNTCGTLWNLSARCPRDQKTLWELDTVPKLRRLMHSKHKMIVMGATATLRNLLTARNVANTFSYAQPSFRSSLHQHQHQHQQQQPQQQQQQRTTDGPINLQKCRPPVLGASCRSRSAEDNREKCIEERPMSSKSWNSSFSRHPSSPLGDEESHNDEETNLSMEKCENSKKLVSERRKGSPAESTFFEQRLDTEHSTYGVMDGDQPIDYSKKYIENGNRRSGNSSNGGDDGGRKQNQNLKIKAVRRDKAYHQERNTNIFGDYAETDLDQPTDYSLRYAEDDTDDEEKQNTEYFTVNEQEDTVKTYCTEGTPYETPCNFSTATSMSNLRLEETKDGEILKKMYKKSVNIKDVEFKNDSAPKEEVLHEKVTGSMKSDSAVESNNPQDKPMYYYDEGTPGIVSRVNSLSSLESAIVTRSEEVTNEVSEDSEHIQQKVEKSEEGSPEESVAVIEEKDNRIIEEKSGDKEGKVVTFGGEDHYAEETPLMFSRSSSLGSLSGFEQYSIHDDRSSIISDFSRRTSGIVSPSELPDSPTQTVPPSPRHQKNPIDFSIRTQDERRSLPFSKNSFSKTKTSVFEDDTAAFKEESTPIEFSAATSLSSLTIDDDPKPLEEPEVIVPLPILHQQEDTKRILPAASSPMESMKEIESLKNIEVNDRGPDDVSDGDEEDGDEDILAACINMGMQNNRYRQSFKKNETKMFPTSVSNLIRYQTSSTLDRLETINTETKRSSLSPLKTKLNIDLPMSDTVHVYCTEDTPADISPVGSQSNLSALSLPSIVEDFEKPDGPEEDRIDLSDDNSNLSGDDDKILDECIQSGMPKRISPAMTMMSTKSKSEVFLPRLNEFSGSSKSSVNHDNVEYLTRSADGHCEDSNNSYEDSPNHSDDDDAILAECIKSAMPKVRPNLLTPKTAISRQTDNVEKSFDNSIVDQLKSPRSDDSLSLSEEEDDMILAQCIRSGMPKASTSAINFPSVPRDDGRRLYGVLSSPRNFSSVHITQQKDVTSMASRDEISDFATEDTPCNFSVVSEMSNLSINSNFDSS